MQDLLKDGGIHSDICTSLSDLEQRLDDTTLFVVIAEEGLDGANIRPLAKWLASQPPWSDLPFIVLTFGGSGDERNPRAAKIVDILGNVSFLERPFHPTTFVSLAKSASRARQRQYSTRGHLEALQRSENAVRESEERFRTLADNVALFAWMADKDGSIFWYNKRWFDFTGTTLDEMRGWGWTQVHHPDYVERVVEKIQKSWDTGEPWEDTFPLRGADGHYRWFLSRAHGRSTRRKTI
jgi:PAS domain S-box-containing protein